MSCLSRLHLNVNETLQACASISVSKLYNFHFPYLVTFVNQFFSFCFVPKYLGLPLHTKYFVKQKKCLLFQ